MWFANIFSQSVVTCFFLSFNRVFFFFFRAKFSNFDEILFINFSLLDHTFCFKSKNYLPRPRF